MDTVYGEFERHLAELRERYRHDPRQEMLYLFLVALEREEIVAIGYREEAIAQRLASMSISDEVRNLVRHSLIWAWKDEEMHSIYIRGALLRIGRPLLRLRAYATQAAGAVGGWAASVSQHVRWRKAPFTRGVASVVMLGGRLTGKVPATVRNAMQYGPFRDFCRFNVDAEKTAWLCWQRLAELAEQDASLPDALADDFRRIEADERRHLQLFEVLSEAFDENDRLGEGWSVARLVERIGAIGDAFLPRELRPSSVARNPLGAGGRVWVHRGSTGDNKREAFRSLLSETDLATVIKERAAGSGKPLAELAIAVKATFMLGYDRRDMSHVTDPELLDELARWLRDLGCARISVVEAPNIYDHFYQRRSVAEVGEYLGFGSGAYELVDLGKEQVEHAYSRGMAQYTVGKTWRDADVRISFAKLRSHPIEMAHLSVANVEWTGARCDEFLFSERQAQRETALMMILDAFPPDYALIDAYDSAADGLIGAMGCPAPKAPRRMYAGRDALSVDTVAMRHIGVQDPRESILLKTVFHWFGILPPVIQVIGCDEPIEDWRGPHHTQVSSLLSLLAFPVYVMGSGRGALFVPQMNREAFPPIEPESLFVRCGRSFTRALLGLRLR